MYRLLVISCTFMLAFASSNLHVKECAKSGWTCENCTTRVMCVNTDGNLNKIDRIHCPASQTCLQGKCTADLNPLCEYDDLPFPCNYQGLFPHPGDWTKYIFCKSTNTDPKGPNFISLTLSCEPGTGYSSKYFYCNKDLAKIADSEFPIKPCLKESNEPIALPGNPTIYYMCLAYGPNDKLYPHQYACPSGGRFIGGKCKPHLE